MNLDGVEQQLVVARETDYTQELHALVLQVVTVQVLKHLVKQPREHRVVFPHLNVGLYQLLACFMSHFCEALMLNKACNDVFAEIEQLFTVVLLVALVHHDLVDLDVCCVVAHFALLASEHGKHVLDVVFFNVLDIV